MNKLTDSEIVKALERCGQHRECCYCNSVEECGNKRVLTESCLDIINRQKAEIERLEKARQKQAQFLGEERGQKYELLNKITNAKTEVIKEFAERLKCRSHRFKTIDRIFVDCIPLDYIDNLVKEMTEQTNFEKVEHNSLCETETYKGGE